MPCLLLIEIPFCTILLPGMGKYASGLFDFILTAGHQWWHNIIDKWWQTPFIPLVAAK